MLVKKLLYLILLFLGQGPCSRLMGTTVVGLASRARPVDQEIKAACVIYLGSKGFSGFDIQTVEDSFWDTALYSNVYAFTVPSRAVIYLSPTMIASIKGGLEGQQAISIYDRFVLLHELGHQFPYGCELPIWGRRIGMFAYWGFLGFLCSGTGLIIMQESPFRPSELLRKTLMTACVASIISMGSAVYLYRTLYRPILQKFKKYTFTHADKTFEKYIKDGCDERDADAFAYEQLSTSELTQLRDYLSAYSASSSRVDEDGYHASMQEMILAIVAGLEKGHV